MNGRLRTVLAAAIAIVAIGIGCGDEDDSASGSGAAGTSVAEDVNSGGSAADDANSDEQADGAPVTTSSMGKAEFLQRANAACTEAGNGLLERAEAYTQKQGSKGISGNELNAMLIKEVLVPTVEEQYAAIEDLGAPAGEEEELEAILVARQEAIDEVMKVQQTGSVTGTIEKHFDATDDELEAFGLPSC